VTSAAAEGNSLLLADSYEGVNRIATAPLLEPRRWSRWWWAFLVSALLTLLMLVAIGRLLFGGIGIFGNDTTIVWGFPIANYVWWIGIGNAGTLISSMLLLTHQRWRASINRFAEAMTLMAAAIAGLFPILHLGRPMYFYWLAPYPNTMELWPQWRSALVWDFWAVLSYLLFSLFFWYSGLVPDLATLRDRARRPAQRIVYGIMALGWRNSARHWRLYETYYKTMAGLAVPLVCSVHSIVGLDFAASMMPGWQESLFPPYFVVGAMFSGFAMVVVLAALLRWGLHLEALVTLRHFDAMGKILLTGSLIMGASYLTEWFAGWYSGARADLEYLSFVFTGHYAPLYWTMLACNVLIPQLLWFRPVRRSIPWLIVIAVAINLGMWFERILIVWNTLAHGYLPSMWSLFGPTFWDWALLAGSLGLFVLLYLCFSRLFPVVSMHEVRRLVAEETGR